MANGESLAGLKVADEYRALRVAPNPLIVAKRPANRGNYEISKY